LNLKKKNAKAETQQNSEYKKKKDERDKK